MEISIRTIPLNLKGPANGLFAGVKRPSDEPLKVFIAPFLPRSSAAQQGIALLPLTFELHNPNFTVIGTSFSLIPHNSQDLIFWKTSRTSTNQRKRN